MARIFNIIVIAVIFTILVTLAFGAPPKGGHKKRGNEHRRKSTQNAKSSPVKENSGHDSSGSISPSIKESSKPDVKTVGGAREARYWGGHNGGYNGGYGGGYNHGGYNGYGGGYGGYGGHRGYGYGK